MDDLDAALKNYRKAFNAKLDAFEPDISPLDVAIPTLSEQEPRDNAPHKKPIITTDIGEAPQPTEEQEGKSPSKEPDTTASVEESNIQLDGLNAESPEREPPITEPISQPPTPVINRHLVHRVITSFSLKVALGLILLLLL